MCAGVHGCDISEVCMVSMLVFCEAVGLYSPEKKKQLASGRTGSVLGLETLQSTGVQQEYCIILWSSYCAFSRGYLQNNSAHILAGFSTLNIQ